MPAPTNPFDVFDFATLEGVEADTGAGPLPDGDYALQVVSAEIKTTKGGRAIVCKFEIMDKKRFVFNYFNFENSSEQAVKIGLSQLKSFIQCAGKRLEDMGNDVTKLIGLMVIARLKIDGEYNRISYFKPYKGPQKRADGGSTMPTFDPDEALPF